MSAPQTCKRANRSLTRRRQRRKLAVLVAGASVGLAACGDSGDTTAAAAGFGYRPLVQPSEKLAIRQSESLSDFLARGGLSAPEVRRVIEITRPYADWTDPDPGVEGRFHRWPGEPPERIDLKIGS